MADNNQLQTLNSLLPKIKKTSLSLKSFIEKNDLKQVLKSSVELISNLRTEIITPKYYYQLFTLIFDELLKVQDYFRGLIKNGRDPQAFYFSVEQSINILPRFYLITIAGTLFIETNINLKNEIIDDLLSLAKGIQHPIRGLFARYFLLKITKDYFNDINFLLINLKEMNKLWVRIERMKNFGDIPKIRSDLKILVGENISRLSSVPNLNENLYKTKILKPILDIIINCEDEFSQIYIFECIIQAFSNEYNIKSFELLINTLEQIKENVDIKEIFIDIMEKFCKYEKIDNMPELKNISLLEKINDCILSVIDNFIDISRIENISNVNDNDIQKIIELSGLYIQFITNSIDDPNIRNIKINSIIDKLYELIDIIDKNNKKNNTNLDISEETMKLIYHFLLAIVDSPLSIFKFKNFPNIMNHLNEIYKSEISTHILDSLINKYNLDMINCTEKMKALLNFIEPMIQLNQIKNNEYLFLKILNKIAKLVFLPCAKDPYEQIEILKILKNAFSDSTINNDENIRKQKIIIFYNNYINALLLVGYGVNESYDNIINKKKKKSKIQIDFCNKYNFDNNKFNIKKEETFYQFFEILFKELDSTLEELKTLSLNDYFKLNIQKLHYNI